MVVQELGHFGRGEGQDVAQHEHGPLGAREELQRRDEGELDALAPEVPCGRIGAALDVGGLVVGPRLEPDRPADPFSEVAGVGAGGAVVR
ncbi:MAG TPA: hypothetical protein VIP77_01555 [Jiangellaceae bacterium]